MDRNTWVAIVKVFVHVCLFDVRRYEQWLTERDENRSHDREVTVPEKEISETS